jgi:hypothetical protein
MLSVTSDIEAFERSLSDFARRQLPFATALALNDTATDLKDDWNDVLRNSLESPTPFTMRGVYQRRASKNKRVAEVGIKDIQGGYLGVLQEGGVRRPKRKAIPIPVGQKTNKYGNMPKGAVKKLVARPDTFVGKVGGVAGIYKRPKRRKKSVGSPKLMVSFQPRAKYEKKISLPERSGPRARAKFPQAFALRFRQAIDTGR